MEIYDPHAYDWNRFVGPHGNLAKIDPTSVADLCNTHGLPWYSTGWPYSSGIKVYCESDKLWREILNKSKET